MPKVIITKGLPASGKTTWAKGIVAENKNRYKRINKDDLREMLDSGHWSKGNEEFVIKTRDKLIYWALQDGKDVIVDDTNLHPKHEKRIRELVEGMAEVEVKTFDCSVEECIKRDLKRPNSVGEKVIRGMYNQFIRPEVEQYNLPVDKPTAYIFDIDGTLAKMNGRGVFDWKMVGADLLNVPVASVLHELKERGYAIIIFSGRDGECEEETKNWLNSHRVAYDYFEMRKAGDNRKDSIVKKEMFDRIKNNYRILGVFDDRNQVVEMWRSLGLTCFQVAEGDF